ncbi:MAG: GTP-binding protein [Planctomycetaceae bacterium]|nr:GTP-binding protein [Planctomycetaceae bacterium]
MPVLPITVISGFTNAGKSTVVQQLQANVPNLKVAAIDGGSDHSTLRAQLAEISESGQYDYLLIELADVSEPMEFPDILSADTDGNVCDSVEIDTMVTVVDAENFLDDFQSIDELRDRGLARDDNDDRDVVRVLIDQIEFANVILVNKTDLVSDDISGQIRSVLQRLNPEARVMSISHGNVSPHEVIRTQRFQRAWAAGTDAWQTMLSSDEMSEVDEYGISSFVYRARRPFHPQRFWDFWMESEHAPNILRSKGYFWLATKHEMSGFWSHAGQVLAAEPGGAWWAETPRAEWPTDDPELLAELDSVWDEVWGDRRQELLIIGQDLNTAAATNALNQCLLTDSELHVGPHGWKQLTDPFGDWNKHHDCDGAHDHEG